MRTAVSNSIIDVLRVGVLLLLGLGALLDHLLLGLMELLELPTDAAGRAAAGSRAARSKQVAGGRWGGCW